MTTISNTRRIGIIGGSGLRQVQGLRGAERVWVETPWGQPSDEVVIGELTGVPVAFLQRHGPGHTIPPTEINARANVAALRRLGCDQIVSVSAVGSLRAECPPGTLVLVDQFIDRTFAREKSFFERGLVAHVPFAEPTCERARQVLTAAGAELGLPVVGSGTYVVMEGPQFSTRAEAHLHRQFGGTVIGMTAMPEAKLAREAELCYAVVAVPTDHDCWRSDAQPVTADEVSRRMGEVADRLNRFLAAACRRLGGHAGGCPHHCDRALDNAIMTHPEHRDPAAVARVSFVVPRLKTDLRDSPAKQRTGKAS